ncbi:MAG: prepilin peptidase [Suipraeoptans sp.]
MVGASIFSFLNVIIYRVPRKLDFVKVRSFCPGCEHNLNFLDMIPVFGWIFLGGKCRYCKEKISPRYMFIETLGGMLALLVVYLYGFSLKAVLCFALFAVLTIIAFVDIDTMKIPNGFIAALLVVSVISIFVFTGLPWYERLIGCVAASGILLIITMIAPGAFGGGDIKMMAACGIMLGWKMSLMALFLAILFGGLYGIVLLLRKKTGRKCHFAFGPFLCIGVAVAFIWGEQILSTYLSLQ